MKTIATLLAALASLCACATTPQEIRAMPPMASLTVPGQRDALAQCTLRKIDEEIPHLPSTLRLYTDRNYAEILGRNGGHFIWVIEFQPIDPGRVQSTIYISDFDVVRGDHAKTISAAIQSCSSQPA